MKINYAIALAAAACQAQAAQQTISPKVIISSINKITDLSGDTADLAQDPASILTSAPRIISNFVQIVEFALSDITMLGGSTSGLPDPSTVLSMPGMPGAGGLPGLGGSSGTPGTGSSGLPGLGGSSGSPGTGSSGIPGSSGSSGMPGSGTSGMPGSSGSSGVPGSSGSSGVPGTSGTGSSPGMSGSDGSSGGTSGSDGSSGMPGSSGSDESSGSGTSGSSSTPSGSDSPSSSSTGSPGSSGSTGSSGSSSSGSMGSSSSMMPKFSKSDQTGICSAFSDFVKVHQNLLKIIIGQNGILSKTPFTAPIAAVLRILEGGVDRLAFTIIGFVPTCADTAKMDLKMLDATLDKTVDVYSVVPGLGN